MENIKKSGIYAANTIKALQKTKKGSGTTPPPPLRYMQLCISTIQMRHGTAGGLAIKSEVNGAPAVRRYIAANRYAMKIISLQSDFYNKTNAFSPHILLTLRTYF